MRRLGLLFPIVALAACNPGLSPKQHDEATDIADDSADEAVKESDTVQDHEARLEAIENKLGLDTKP